MIPDLKKRILQTEESLSERAEHDPSLNILRQWAELQLEDIKERLLSASVNSFSEIQGEAKIAKRLLKALNRKVVGV